MIKFFGRFGKNVWLWRIVGERCLKYFIIGGVVFALNYAYLLMLICLSSLRDAFRFSLSHQFGIKIAQEDLLAPVVVILILGVYFIRKIFPAVRILYVHLLIAFQPSTPINSFQEKLQTVV